MLKLFAACACLLLCALNVHAQEGKGGHGRERQATPPETFQTDIPAYAGNVILGRPTRDSITLSILARASGQAVVDYRPAGTGLAARTNPFELAGGQPSEIVLSGLQADTAYEYRVLNAETREPLFGPESSGRFHTSRAPGSAFVFTVQADSHLDQNCSPELYRNSLTSEAAQQPDFLVDLGDTFMTGKHSGRDSATRQYDAQRYYLGLVGQVAPVFLVLGNHDGEEVRATADLGADGLAVWSAQQRRRLFPNPAPNRFYTGNDAAQPHVGLLQDYYAWTWGDAQFVVLDPYWTSRSTRGGKEPWNMTLGQAQVEWLGKTLRNSQAKWKFIFTHQLVGGLDRNGRGGAEAAPLFEWGGHDADGRDAFATHRRGWAKPIHDLLKEAGVAIVFHGHDHFFAHQEYDGIVYQLVPQPGTLHANARNMAKDYGYGSGDIVAGAGFLQVAVSASRVTVEFIRTAPQRGAGEKAFSYTLEAAAGR